jgi:hypothetical protein
MSQYEPVCCLTTSMKMNPPKETKVSKEREAYIEGCHYMVISSKVGPSKRNAEGKNDVQK